MASGDFSKIPQELKNEQCWLFAKLVPDPSRPGKLKKIPISAITGNGTEWNQKQNLCSFERAAQFVETHAGYVLAFAFEHSSYLGGDADNAFNKDGTIKPAIGAFLREYCFGFYYEWSPSNKGIRFFVKKSAPVPVGTAERVSCKLHDDCQVEIFCGGFCTVTGRAFSDATAKIKEVDPVDVYSFCASHETADKSADEHGGRNASLTSYAGSLVQKGLNYEESKALILAANARHAQPLPDHDLEQTVLKSLRKWVREGAKPKRKLFLNISKSLIEVADEALLWLWHNVILAGALNLFIGLPDVGKTLVAIYIIARLTRGECFPSSNRKIKPRKVLVICREDSYASMWKSRLLAAGADIGMVSVLHGVSVEGNDEVLPWRLDEPEHVELLKKFLLDDPEIALCVIDPLADFLGHRDMNKADDIRAVTGPLNRVAQETRAAMIVNVHTTKALIDSVIKSAAGSIQLMAAVQISWLFIEDSDVKGQRLMLQGRNKSGKKRGFKYHIESAPWPEQCASRDLEEGEEDDGVGLVVFKGQSNADANDILQRKLDRDEPKNKQIRKWLLELLARGPVPNKHCNEEAFNRGFSRDYVSQVCAQLSVIRNGKTWALPPEDAKSEQEPEPEQEELENLEGAYSPWKKQ